MSLPKKSRAVFGQRSVSIVSATQTTLIHLTSQRNLLNDQVIIKSVKDHPRVNNERDVFASFSEPHRFSKASIR
jgi:hypothetical protein